MAAQDKFILCTLISMFAWTECLGSLRDINIDKADTSAYLKKLFPLDRELPLDLRTRWLVHKTPVTSSVSAPTSQAHLHDQLDVTLNKVPKLTTRESAHEDLLLKLLTSSTFRANRFGSKDLEESHLMFIKDKNYFINFEKICLEMLDATKGKRKLRVSSSSQTIVDEYIGFCLRFSEAGSQQHDIEQSRNNNAVTLVDNKPGVQTLLESEVEINQVINSSRNDNASKTTILKPLEVKKHVFKFVDEISQMTKQLAELRKSLNTYAGNERFRRNTMNGTSYTQTNVTDLVPVNKDDLMFYAEPNNNTGRSDKDIVSETAPGETKDRNDSVPNTVTPNSTNWKENSVKEETYEKTDFSKHTHVTEAYIPLPDVTEEYITLPGVTETYITLPDEKNYTGDTLTTNKTMMIPDLIQERVTEPAANIYNSDTNNTLLDSVDNVETMPTVLSNFSTSVSSATTNLQRIETNRETALLNEVTTIKDTISSEMSTGSSQFQISTNYSEMSTRIFEPSELHSKTMGSETDFWTVEYETATSSVSDLDLNVITSDSTPSDVQTNHIDLSTSSNQTEYESTTSELSTYTNYASSKRDNLDTFTTTFNNHSTDRTISEFEQEVEYSPTNPVITDVYLSNDSMDVISSENGLSTYPLNEVGPDWQVAKETWRYAWEIHIYVFGSLFLLVGLYTMLSFLRLWWIHCLFSSGYFISIHVLLMFLCFTRAFYLLYDGYGSNGTFHASINHFLYSVSFPCLTSIFSVLFFSLLKVTDMCLVAPSLQKLQVLIFIIVVHFGISMAADILWGFYPEIPVMMFISHVYFALWGIFLFLGYVCIVPKLHSHAVKRQKDVVYTSPSMTFLDTGKIHSGETLSAAIKVIFCTAICGLIIVGLEVYGIVAVYKYFIRGRPEPWKWWLYHTGLRMLEFIMCLTLSYVASLPLRYRISEMRCAYGVFFAPCSEIFCCGSNINQQKRDVTTGFNHFEQVSSYNHAYSEKSNSLNENSSEKLLPRQLNFTIPSIDIQPSLSSRPNSLLIIEDGYVRFQTDYDINRIVDSCSDISQKSADAHSMSTFLRTDGFVNTGYSLNPREDKDKAMNNNDFVDKSRKSSMTSSDFFRVPSSISLADSMENELEKAFESFKMDTSFETDKDSGSTDCNVASNLQTSKDTDLVSVASLPGMRSKADIFPQVHANHTFASTPIKDTLQSDGAIRQSFTLPKAIKSPEIFRTAKERDFSSDSNLQQAPDRSLFNEDILPPASNYSPSSVNISLLDSKKQDIQTLRSDDRDHSNLDIPILARRPSEGHGNQAAVLTSFMKSWESGSNENIDV